jgi:hypothetical protein
MISNRSDDLSARAKVALGSPTVSLAQEFSPPPDAYTRQVGPRKALAANGIGSIHLPAQGCS